MPSPLPLDTLLAYRGSLKDALTGHPVTSTSRLVTLHQPDLRSQADRTLVNLTNTARPGKVCTLITDSGGSFPPDDVARKEYRVTCTFNRLLCAPVIRIIIDWDATVKASADSDHPLEVALDFHFNATDAGLKGIEELELRKHVNHDDQVADELCFVSHGATVAKGLTLARKNASIGVHGQRLVEHLCDIVKTTTRVRLRFMTPWDATDSAFPQVWPYISGEEVEKLPALSSPEWSSFPLEVERHMLDLFYGPNPFPCWLPFRSEETFATITEASVELYESARLTYLESEEILRDWASVTHSGLLWKFGRAAILGLQNSNVPQNSPIRRLGNTSYSNLPDRLMVRLSLTAPDGRDFALLPATRCTIPVRLPVAAYDILFVIENVSSALADACGSLDEASRGPLFEVKVDAKPSKWMLQQQLETAGPNMKHPGLEKWHPIILNQSHNLTAMDLSQSSPLPSTEIEEAYQRILRLKVWNAEQLMALKSVRNALGGLVLISGPAGTGKTLVTEALVVFLHTIGLHILVLAPANSNCTDFVRRFVRMFPDIVATRVFPSSADRHVDKIVENIRKAHADQGTGDLADLDMVRTLLQASGQRHSIHQDYGLPAQVLNAAREGKYSLIRDVLRQRKDVWRTLKEFVDASDCGTFRWEDLDSVEMYRTCYNECKAHYMAVATRLCVTTTGNVRSSVIRDNYAQGKYDSTCNGLVVIIDEACKDREVDTLSALLLPEWTDRIKGLVLLGDERQLTPTNMSADGRIAFNPFRQRGSIPLFNRLKAQGFQTVTLVEQHRMSSKISRFPHENFYPLGTMRDGPATHSQLSDSLLGLHECLKSILQSLPRTRSSPILDFDSDETLRTHYFQLRGTRDKSTMSPLVRDHVRFFFDKIYWHLREYFAEKLEENVMVICAYKGARNHWMEAMSDFQRRFRIPNCQMPRILTIDSSQGCEATVTIVDCSIQEYDPDRLFQDIGFVDNDARMNVALTRAKEVRWVLGGNCVKGLSTISGHPAYVRYRAAAGATNCLSIVKNTPLQLNSNWLKFMKNKRDSVKLAVHYKDDIAR